MNSQHGLHAREVPDSCLGTAPKQNRLDNVLNDLYPLHHALTFVNNGPER